MPPDAPRAARSHAPITLRTVALLHALLAWGCGGESVAVPLTGLDAALDAPRDARPAPDANDANDASDTEVASGAADAGDTRDATVVDAATAPGPVELGTGQDYFMNLPRAGGRVELVHGPQGGWHVYGRVRLRGIAPDVYLTFSLVPEEGGAPVNLANETVRRQERHGLILVGDVYESSVGELVILADGVRPPDVVGRRFRFGVRVERPDPVMLRVLVGSDERVVDVIDEVP
jgi:hypothetical protein